MLKRCTLDRCTLMIAACAALATAGGVCAPSAFAAKKHHHKHKTRKPTAPAGVTKDQVVTIIQQYLAQHPQPIPSAPPAPVYRAGTGLTLSNNVFSFNPSVVQARETANCPANQFLQGLGANGAPSCTFALAPATNTNSTVTLSAMRQAVVSTTAPAGGHQLVFAQVYAQRTTANAGDSVSCVLNDLTAAPGTDYGNVTATFPTAGGGTSYVDVPLQSVIPTSPGDTVAVSCVGGTAGYTVNNANIALIPMA